jgi:probable rRNA maturation factor
LDLNIIVETGLPPDLDLERLRTLAGFVLAAEGAGGDWGISLVLTDDARLQVLHRDFMGIDAPTDVMTFPSGEAMPGVPAVQGGDVVVSVERAAAQAADYGHSAAEEITFLVVHGLLHLAGWNDAAETARGWMLDRQSWLIAAFDRSGPTATAGQGEEGCSASR